MSKWKRRLAEAASIAVGVAFLYKNKAWAKANHPVHDWDQ